MSRGVGVPVTTPQHGTQACCCQGQLCAPYPTHCSRPSHSPRAWWGPERAWQGPRCCEGLEKVSTARNSLPIIRLFRPSPKKLQSLKALSDSQHRRAAQRHRGVIFTALFIAADIIDTPGMEICPCSPPRWGHETVWLAACQPSPIVGVSRGTGGPRPHKPRRDPEQLSRAGRSGLLGIRELSLSVLKREQSWGWGGRSCRELESGCPGLLPACCCPAARLGAKPTACGFKIRPCPAVGGGGCCRQALGFVAEGRCSPLTARTRRPGPGGFSLLC